MARRAGTAKTRGLAWLTARAVRVITAKPALVPGIAESCRRLAHQRQRAPCRDCGEIALMSCPGSGALAWRRAQLTASGSNTHGQAGAAKALQTERLWPRAVIPSQR